MIGEDPKKRKKSYRDYQRLTGGVFLNNKSRPHPQSGGGRHVSGGGKYNSLRNVPRVRGGRNSQISGSRSYLGEGKIRTKRKENNS